MDRIHQYTGSIPVKSQKDLAKWREKGIKSAGIIHGWHEAKRVLSLFIAFFSLFAFCLDKVEIARNLIEISRYRAKA